MPAISESYSYSIQNKGNLIRPVTLCFHPNACNLYIYVYKISIHTESTMDIPCAHKDICNKEKVKSRNEIYSLRLQYFVNPQSVRQRSYFYSNVGIALLHWLGAPFPSLFITIDR